MNAVSRTPSLPSTPLGVEEARRLAISALVDGELSPSELDGLLQGSDDLADWNTFHLIGDVLRGTEPVLPSRLSPDFASQVILRLRDEPAVKPMPQETVVHLRGAPANDAVVPLEARGRVGLPGSGGCRGMGAGRYGGSFVWRGSATGSDRSRCCAERAA